MSDAIMAPEAETETAAIETQDKMFTQTELDKIVADRVDTGTEEVCAPGRGCKSR